MPEETLTNVIGRHETFLTFLGEKGPVSDVVDAGIPSMERVLNWLMFDTIFEAVEARIKAYYLAGKISREDLNQIFKKYGIA